MWHSETDPTLAILTLFHTYRTAELKCLSTIDAARTVGVSIVYVFRATARSVCDIPTSRANILTCKVAIGSVDIIDRDSRSSDSLQPATVANLKLKIMEAQASQDNHKPC